MIRTETADGVTRVTLDRPAARNALRPTALDELAAAVTEAPTPVVLLSGAGSAFCAGADLDSVASLSEPAAFARRGQRTARRIETADAVVVAGVDGAARGGGVELALACDLRVATPAASFAESGVRHGLFGAWGGTHRLPATVGQTVAADMALTGRTLDASAAARVGLVSRVVDEPSSVATAVADAPADTLARLSTLLTPETRRRERAEAAERRAFAALHAAHVDEIGADREG
ncbi:enoyl-CoA hydratase/isomerase family protein [Halobaculum sp. MBLA0143]|uniref:enoyl-CoA hydratase/isomerase family protein n=1 Tax=Halobaculum sp. MBLA0143 TaxID=3079933 RepID=UPI0035256232